MKRQILISWAHLAVELSSVSYIVLDNRVFTLKDILDSVKGKIQESGKPCANFNINAFFPTGEASTVTGITMLDNGLAASGVPPRLISDQLMNIFFQEWAPMYPVLHRPTFLKLYADYTADPQSISNLQAVAQLHLVFGIAALSSEVRMLRLLTIDVG